MSKFVVGFVAVACAVTLSAYGQNKVVFDNQSGDPALVKLVGPTKTEVEVPNGAKVGADVAAGQYTIKVRYGTPGNYRYSKGEEFTVTETATARSETTITLHKVVAGNYDSQPITEAQFGATVSPPPTPKHVQPNGVKKELVRLKWLPPTDEPKNQGGFSDVLSDLSYTSDAPTNQYVSIVVTVRSPDGKTEIAIDTFQSIADQGHIPSDILMMSASLGSEHVRLSGRILVSVAVYSTTKGLGNEPPKRDSVISNVVTAELNKK